MKEFIEKKKESEVFFLKINSFIETRERQEKKESRW